MDKNAVLSLMSPELSFKTITLLCQRAELVLTSRDRGREALEVLRQLLVLSLVRVDFEAPLSLQRAIRDCIETPNSSIPFQSLVGNLFTRLCNARNSIVPSQLIINYISQRPPIKITNEGLSDYYLRFLIPLMQERSGLKDIGILRGGHLHDLLLMCLDDASLLPTVVGIYMNSHRMIRHLQEENDNQHLLPNDDDAVEMECIAAIEERMIHYLSSAPLVSDASKAQKGLFSSIMRKESVPVTEIDQTKASGSFTVLSLSAYYDRMQIGNIICFSMLENWLREMYLIPNLEKDAPHRRCPSARFSRVILAYCERVFSQSKLRINDAAERKRLTPFIENVIIAAIRITTVLIQLEESMVSVVFQHMRQIFNRNCVRTNAHLCLQLLEFFITQCASQKYDPEPLFRTFFEQHFFHRYVDPDLAFDTLDFCLRHRVNLLKYTNVFQVYFPTIFKLFAWDPYSLNEDISQLLPATISKSTYIEVFHLLLDLPLVASAMEEDYKFTMSMSSSGGGEPNSFPASTASLSSLPSLHDSRAAMHSAEEQAAMARRRVVFNYLLRDESGVSINFWENESTLPLLMDFCNALRETPRVRRVCTEVPRLLELYCDVICSSGGKVAMRELVTVIGQRMSQTYPSPEYGRAVRLVMNNALLRIFSNAPSFVLSMRSFMCGLLTETSVESKKELILNICFLMGEHFPTMMDSSLNAANDFHEALELLLYERLSLVKLGITDIANLSGHNRRGHDGTKPNDSGEKVVRRKRGLSVISELQSDSSKFLAPSSNNASATTPLPRRDRSGFAAAPHASNTSTTVFTSLQHSGSSYSPRSFLNSLSRESENEPPKSPLKQTRKNEKKEGCDEYTTRLMLVVVSSLGKIAAKCPELLHRVSVSLSKVLGFEEYFPLVVMEKVKGILQLLRSPNIAHVVLGSGITRHRHHQAVPSTSFGPSSANASAPLDTSSASPSSILSSSSILFLLTPSESGQNAAARSILPLHPFTLTSTRVVYDEAFAKEHNMNRELGPETQTEGQSMQNDDEGCNGDDVDGDNIDDWNGDSNDGDGDGASNDGDRDGASSDGDGDGDGNDDGDSDGDGGYDSDGNGNGNGNGDSDSDGDCGCDSDGDRDGDNRGGGGSCCDSDSGGDGDG